MATCRLYREGKIEEEDFDPARVSDLLQEPDTLVWLDMEDPSEKELAMLQEEFELHPLAVEDARHQEQRPRSRSTSDSSSSCCTASTGAKRSSPSTRSTSSSATDI
jgi:Mg2+ and Co2+ transporter CorA